MDVWYFIMEIGLLLGSAFVLGAVAQRFRQSAIVGYLLAGAVLGPLLFNKAAIQNVAELGVALLLFSIGLEFSFSRLRSMGSRVFLIGALQILVTMGVFGLVFSFRGPIQQALALGAVVALSSTAIVLRVLVDRTEIDSVHGRNALGILLTQDAAVVPLVLLVTILGHGGDVRGTSIHILKTIASAGGLAAVFFVLFYIVIPKALMTGKLFVNRELVVLLAVSVAICSTWAAHAIGLSPALGAFIAGMLLAESPFAVQFRSDISSLRTLFVTLFFTSIGMLADPGWFLSNWIPALFLLLLVYVLKGSIICLICLVFRFNLITSLATGITLAQIGEFSFVLASEAYRGGIVAENEFDLIVTVTILSMFLAPYMTTYALPLARRFVNVFSKHMGTREPAMEEVTADHFFIIGFGPAGQRVADVLLENGISPAVIELNPKTAAVAREKKLTVHLADATNSDIISHIGIKDACMVIVTVPDPRSANEIIRNLRLYSSKLLIIARSRYHSSSRSLSTAGANVVVDEEFTIGHELAREVIKSFQGAGRNDMGCFPADEKSKRESCAPHDPPGKNRAQTDGCEDG